MKIDLLKLKDKEIYSYNINDEWMKELSDKISASESFTIAKEAKVEFSFEKTCDDSKAFIVHCTIDTPLKAQCSHCLVDFTYNIKEKLCFVAENKQTKIDAQIESEDSLDFNESDEDGNVFFMNNYKLDLFSIVTDSILLNVPYAFLCREDCMGLCSECGINKNNEKCECGKKFDFSNNKFAGLKELKALEV